jgi:hypothetical protein
MFFAILTTAQALEVCWISGFSSFSPQRKCLKCVGFHVFPHFRHSASGQSVLDFMFFLIFATEQVPRAW